MNELLTEQDDESSVGVVTTHTAELFAPPHPLKLQTESELGPIQVAYECYGTLSPEKDNAIFVCHALTGDAHAAGVHEKDERKPGWWDPLIGPGKGLDTNRYYIICANVVGGCQGTTGPSSIDPETGEAYTLSFPFITVGDMVEVHYALCKKLGIEKLLGIIGGSLGGMQVLDWVARYPDSVHAAIILASSAKLSAQGIAFNAVGRRAIYADPNFHQGHYSTQDATPTFGLALARMIAHITYLSEASIEMKFGRRLQESDELAYDLLRETEFQIESYLHYQGKRFVQRFDANSYLYLTRAMDYFDLAQSYGSLEKAFEKTKARFLIASYTTDWLFPCEQSRDIVRALIKAKKQVSAVELESPFGHDAFLLEIETLQQMISPFLNQSLQSIRKHQRR